jgi:hypothetical protein
MGGQFSTQRLQEAADALEQSAIRLAHAMSNPKDTEELNAARAERTRLEQQLGALAAPGGPRAYGSGCRPNPTGYRDLEGHGETGANNALYAGPDDYDPGYFGPHHYQLKPVGQQATPNIGPTGHKATPSFAGNSLPAHDYSQPRRPR